MTLERTGFNGRKVSDWLRPSHTKWQESFWLAETLPCDKRAVFNYLAPIIDSSTVTWSMALLSLEVRRETNSRSSRQREAVWSLHDIYIVHSANAPGVCKIKFLVNTISITIVNFMYTLFVESYRRFKHSGNSQVYAKFYFLFIYNYMECFNMERLVGWILYSFCGW